MDEATKKANTGPEEQTVSETNSKLSKGQNEEINSTSAKDVRRAIAGLGIADLFEKQKNGKPVHKTKTGLRKKSRKEEETPKEEELPKIYGDIADKINSIKKAAANNTTQVTTQATTQVTVNVEKISSIAEKMAELENSDISINFSMASLFVSLIACLVSIVAASDSIKTMDVSADLIALIVLAAPIDLTTPINLIALIDLTTPINLIALINLIAFILLFVLIVMITTIAVVGLVMNMRARGRHTSCMETAIAVELLDLV